MRVERCVNRRELTYRLGREPTYEEIAEHAGISAAKVDQVLNEILKVYNLDAQLSRGVDGDASLMDVITDEDAVLPDDQAIFEGLDGRRALKLLAGLSEMEQDIVKRRFGLGGVAVEALESIGQSYDLSRADPRINADDQAPPALVQTEPLVARGRLDAQSSEDIFVPGAAARLPIWKKKTPAAMATSDSTTQARWRTRGSGRQAPQRRHRQPPRSRRARRNLSPYPLAR